MAKKTCKFCHKSDDETTVMLAFPDDLCICDECVSLMVEIIAKDHAEWRERQIDTLQKMSRPSTLARPPASRLQE